MPEEVIVGGAEEAGAVDGKIALVAKTNTRVLAANARRTGGVVSNEGAHDAWLALGGSAAVEKAGVYLKKEGGTFDLAGYDGEVRAISSEAVELTVAEIESTTGSSFSGSIEFDPAAPTEEETHAPAGFTNTPGLILPGVPFP